MELLEPACKCCGGATLFFAGYDFSRTCEDQERPVFASSGIDIPYYRCTSCGFVFTTYFDRWSKETFAERIYNSEYVLADPDFAAARPKYIAEQLGRLLAAIPADIKILDYGGGEGRLIRELQQRGFEKGESFDPFFSDGARPQGPFELMTAFEVAEHTADPVLLFRDALSFLAQHGVLLFTTALQDRKPDRDWWYIAPRNGHISIHSYASLQRLAAAVGATCLSLDDNLHMFYRDRRSAIARQIAGNRRSPALYAASRHGFRSFFKTAGLLGKLGSATEPRDARHLARVALISCGLR
ncbi:MAG TPA: class I SAM-dependent methyltransferase [Rhizomicrobium sp.]|nr:class I SAM-dependent methyltransferase [Rhizomicrobium sp.]